ncbi:signal peptidase I [Enterococcus crotali]|uniref:signal peptidase I n=1 Tax=Enterococcus crotali TaxID=1453587 RepID=UPI0004728E2A|nr:signal peptidase I [Enterococcus crotali]OTP49947.1 signal peptidase I [Enterococcus termitis]
MGKKKKVLLKEANRKKKKAISTKYPAKPVSRKNTQKRTSKSTMRKKAKRAKARKSAKAKQHKQFVRQLLFSLGISFVLLSMVFLFTIKLAKVSGYSMTPVLNDEDRIVVFKRSEIKRFSLILFKRSGKEASALRVVGLPGEELSYKNGELIVNGVEIPERFLSNQGNEFAEAAPTEDFTLINVTKMKKVPEDSYFVLGDNRTYATDSRYFGFVKKKQVYGVIKARIFPLYDMRQF